MNSSPTTHAKPCTAVFYPSSAMQARVKRATSPRGGTLASANSPGGGHFLFRELAHNLTAHVGNPNEAAVVRPAASRRARRQNRRYLPAAKSRPSPFPVVDHVAHSLVSSVPLGRTCETKRSSFHEVGKIVHECDC
jgi:hypothetical protein